MSKQGEIADLKETLTIAKIMLENVTKQLDDLEEKHKTEKWEPKGGEWYVNPLGIEEGSSIEHTRNYGVEFQTRDQAFEGNKNFRAYHRCYQAWLEIVGDWRPDWNNDNQKKYYTFYNGSSFKKEDIRYTRHSGTYYFKTERQLDKFIEMAEEDLLILAGVK